MTKWKNREQSERNCESNQGMKDNFWYSMALLTGNIGIIVKILIGFMTDRKK